MHTAAFSSSAVAAARFVCLALGSLAFVSPVLAQNEDLAARLGYEPGTRLLIVHADDLGMAHSINEASITAMTEGSVTSASVMMPTPWVMEVVAAAAEHPELDLGLHLTITSEWTNYRWGPMARDSVSSLLDEDHYLAKLCHQMAERATPDDVERELRAQVEQALRLGLRPTHLDSHMGCLLSTRPEYFAAYLRVARDYDLPALIGHEELRGGTPEFQALLGPDDLVVDRVMGAPEAAQGRFRVVYDSLLRALPPGLHVLLLHCGHDNAELQAATYPQRPYGSAWREEDFAYFSSAELAELLEAEGIVLTTWREVYARWKARD